MRRKKTVNRIAASGIAGMLALMSVFPAMAETGWVQSGGKTYYYEQNGVMAKGLRYLDGNYYYFLSDGSMVTGWLKLDGEYYYMLNNGALTTGWRQIGDDWYYLRPDSGKCVINDAIEIDGYWYFFKIDGKRLTGWLKKGGSFYYLDPAGDGRLTAGTTMVIDGASYSFAPDGVCTSTGYMSNYYDFDNPASPTQNQTSTQSYPSSGSKVLMAPSTRTNKGPGVSSN